MRLHDRRIRPRHTSSQSARATGYKSPPQSFSAFPFLEARPWPVGAGPLQRFPSQGSRRGPNGRSNPRFPSQDGWRRITLVLADLQVTAYRVQVPSHLLTRRRGITTAKHRQQPPVAVDSRPGRCQDCRDRDSGWTALGRGWRGWPAALDSWKLRQSRCGRRARAG